MLDQATQRAFVINKSFFRTSVLAGTIFLSGINQSVQATPKSIVAVEPLVCDLVNAIVPPSQPVTCLIDRKQDVHDVKISPRQAQTLKNASQIFTLGSEMTPAIKRWLDNPITVVVGVSAIDVDDHNDHSEGKHDEHNDHSEGKHEEHDVQSEG